MSELEPTRTYSNPTATELLRRMLDERGVAHSDHYFSTTWRDGHGILHLAGEPMADGSLVVDMLTPEQAIAATLGSGILYGREQIEALEAKWKAEDVTLGSELKPDGLPVGLTISEDGELLNWRGENYVKQSTLGSGEITAEQVRETVEKHWHDLPDEYDMPEAIALPEYSYDWQAIADELNAALGGGECENVAPDYLDFLCSVCGFVHYHSDENDTGNGNDWAYCPRCGKAVKR